MSSKSPGFHTGLLVGADPISRPSHRRQVKIRTHSNHIRTISMSKELPQLYAKSHNYMRNIDGLQPPEAFDELLKYLFYRETQEEREPLLIEGATPSQIRKQFKRNVELAADWVTTLWPEKALRLSDAALSAIHEIFEGVSITNIPADVRSIALREFVGANARKGLGIFLTPDSVVQAIVRIANPGPKDMVYDPACGSGTFLAESIRHIRSGHARSKPVVFGTDKSPRMLMLADLNLGHDKGTTFHKLSLDSLFDIPEKGIEHFNYDAFDYVFTNPPFGVYLDHLPVKAHHFGSCKSPSGALYTRQQSEAVFLEQCLRFVNPGGMLSIVVPRSVVSNVTERIETARRVSDELGYVLGGFSLPPETFAATGTQTTTVVLFIRKYAAKEDRSALHRMVWIDIQNVGYDSTGRMRAGEELTKLPELFALCLRGNVSSPNARLLPPVAKNKTLQCLPDFLSKGDQTLERPGVALKELVLSCRTGRTPARSAYADAGLFILKVGNLTGQGIDWTARDRNYVEQKERPSRERLALILQTGDIVLTSSAHSPVYIAKKVDIVGTIPEYVGSAASVVGELMLVRPDPKKIDPYVLLAFLRAPSTMEKIQRMVRGQTAHLHSDDLLDLTVPLDFLSPSPARESVVSMLKEEVGLSSRLSELNNVQDRMLNELLPIEGSKFADKSPE